MTKVLRVAILQHRLLHYRIKFFECLRAQLDQLGIELVLVHGQASATEALRKDEGKLDWALRVRNIGFRIAGRDIIWQPMPSVARQADLCIMIQENRILSNYWLQLRRPFRSQLLGFWGHGRNFQSDAPEGLLEAWKRWWLRRVDWWFAYTGLTKSYIVASGFNVERVVNLENAIDGSGFRDDLQSWEQEDLSVTRKALGIQSNSQVAIYCGSLYAEKRIETLLASADLVRQRLPEFHLLVLGSGPEATRVDVAAKSRPWLHSLGIHNGRNKAKYFRLAQLMLNPGLVGLHVVDAFVAQTPLVTQSSARHSPEYDYLVHGENGWIVYDDSPTAYADAVVKIFSSPDLLFDLQKRCSQDAYRYTLDNMVNNFAKGIVACLATHGRYQCEVSSTNGDRTT